MKDNQLKRWQEIELSISDLAFGGKGISKVDELAGRYVCSKISFDKLSNACSDIDFPVLFLTK